MYKVAQPAKWPGNIPGNQHTMGKTLMRSCCFGIFLLAVRIIVTGSLMFGFLLWNLFLAFVPYFLTNLMIKNPGFVKNRIAFLLLFLLWLMFIPNSFYILTDFFHLDDAKAAPEWFNLVLIFSFAWNGLLAGIISLRQMEKIAEPFISANRRWIFLYGIMGLNALGIYIGRYLRFNSWDIIANPFQLAEDIIYLGIHPVRNINEWGMIFCFTVLMILVYQSIRKISHLVL